MTIHFPRHTVRKPNKIVDRTAASFGIPDLITVITSATSSIALLGRRSFRIGRSRVAAMKRKTLIAGCLALAILTGTVVWLLASPSKRRGAEIPITLLGYTNDVTGILAASYATTDIAHTGFAVFSVHNPTRRDFFCYIGPVFFQDHNIPLRHAQLGDFDLPPGATVTFAVPLPDTRDAWRCGLQLCHRRNYPQWKYQLVRFAQRWGLDRPERTWFAVSPEIAR